VEQKINRKNDVLFKEIFASEGSKDIVADMLNAILDIEITAEEIVYIQTQIGPQFNADKSVTLDIQIASSKTGDKINIEMQIKDQKDIERRILYYWARSFATRIKKKQKYQELPRQIHILIADFNIFEFRDKNKYHSVFQVREKEEMTLFSNALEIHVIELAKFRKLSKELKLKSPIGKWMLYLDNEQGELMEKIANEVPMIKKAIKIEKNFMRSGLNRQLYEAREKALRDYDATVEYAFEKGERRGEKRGEARGMKKEKIIIAQNLLALSLPLNQIAQATGLSLAEIKKIKN
jgi:predicted transposase/invertase (TIGR01784 family)